MIVKGFRIGRVFLPPKVYHLMSLLGYLRLKETPRVTGSRLMQTMSKSGIRPERIDKYAVILTEKRYVTYSGFNRAKKYELTTPSVAEAERLVQASLANVPAV